MFFAMFFELAIVMPPSSLHADLKNLLKAKLVEKVQGSVTQKYGYVVCVISVEDPSPGKVMNTSGDVLFNLKYKAVVMKPFVGEVADGVVEKVDRFGMRVSMGPVKVFISGGLLPSGYKFSPDKNIYESNEDEIKENSEVRFRVIGVSFEGNEFHLTGTMKENYLGLL